MADQIGQRSVVCVRCRALPTAVLFLSVWATFRAMNCAVALSDDAVTGPGKTTIPREESHLSRSARPDVVAKQTEPAPLNAMSRLTFNIEALGQTKAGLSAAKLGYSTAVLVFGEKSSQAALAMTGLGYCYATQGDHASARPLLERAVALYRKLYPPGKPIAGHQALATALEVLAGVHQLQGDFAKAERTFQESLRLQQNLFGENHIETAANQVNLAWLYDSMGDYARAEPRYRQALEISRKVLGENHPYTSRCLNGLARLYRSMGEYSKAELLLRQALDIDKRVVGENHPYTAASLDSLASLYWSQGEYAKAEPLFRQALQIRREVQGENHPSTAASLNNLALLNWSMGEYATAEPLYRQALAIRKKVLGESHPHYALSLSNLAFLYEFQGDYAKAKPLLRQALEIYEKHLASTLEIQSERQQLVMADLLRSNLDDYLSVTLESQESAANVYRHILAWKGAIFMRQLAGNALRSRPDLKPQFDELASVDVRLSTLALRPADQQPREVWERQLAELSDRKEALERKLSGESAQFGEQRALLNLKPADLQKVLPQNAALVDVLEYWHSRPSAQKRGKWTSELRLMAFVVRSDRPIVRVELGRVEPLAEAAQRWRHAILRDGGSAERFAGDGAGSGQKPPQQILKEAVWSPLQKELDGAEIVLVSPDGVLNQVPLAALPGKKAGSYLVEETKLAVVPVPRLLPLLLGPSMRSRESATAAAGRGPEQSLLVVGDVNYGGSPGKSPELQMAAREAVRGSRGGPLAFFQLEYTRSEMATIRDSFEKNFPEGRVKLLRGAQATKSAFRNDAPKCRWLHLATHGFFAPPEILSALAPPKEDKERGFGEFGRQGVIGYHPGLLSGVALSGANTPPQQDEDDGILTAIDVAGLDLESAELVVLSACETGLGFVAGGEGVLGLQRAFQLAGAKTTVASLWKIPDRATMQLMQRFYENLWDKKMSKLEALREAQIWMLKEGRQRGLDLEDARAKKPAPTRLPPRYWAAFVLSGDWR